MMRSVVLCVAIVSVLFSRDPSAGVALAQYDDYDGGGDMGGMGGMGDMMGGMGGMGGGGGGDPYGGGGYGGGGGDPYGGGGYGGGGGPSIEKLESMEEIASFIASDDLKPIVIGYIDETANQLDKEHFESAVASLGNAVRAATVTNADVLKEKKYAGCAIYVYLAPKYMNAKYDKNAKTRYPPCFSM
jgi:hypothetical protein